jgi:D-alanyl-D-alanine carboxypeptidase
MKTLACFPGLALLLLFKMVPLNLASQPSGSTAPVAFNVASENLISVNELGVRAGLLYDIETNSIVWKKDLDYAYPIASLTKMMVALLVLEDVHNCNADWNDRLELKNTLITRVKKRKVCKVVTDTYSLDAMLRLAMIVSHNEACNVIARHLSGTVEAFVERMNARAAELNMNNTFFSNPNGLPALRSELDNHSSAKDMLILALELLKYPELIAITRIGYCEITSERTSNIYRNHNRLVIDFENEVDGLKTGFTRNARYCLAASANKKGRRLIAIAIGSPSKNARADFVASLFTSYYDLIGVGKLGYTDEQYLAYRENKVKMENSEEVAAIDTRPKPVLKSVWSREKVSHHVRQGETLAMIAQKYSCSVTDLKKWNKLKNSFIAKGQKLVVYTLVKKQIEVDEEQLQPGDSEEDNSDNANQEKSSASGLKMQEAVNERKLYYIVQPGDTLWNIARKHNGLTVEELRKINNLQPGEVLKPGMKLKVINES